MADVVCLHPDDPAGWWDWNSAENKAVFVPAAAQRSAGLGVAEFLMDANSAAEFWWSAGDVA